VTFAFWAHFMLHDTGLLRNKLSPES